jgi:hypothetical protein
LCHWVFADRSESSRLDIAAVAMSGLEHSAQPTYLAFVNSKFTRLYIVRIIRQSRSSHVSKHVVKVG